MPCFTNGPEPGTQEYEEWLPTVQSRWESFVHVVDYYFGKADEPVPYPEVVDGDTLRAWNNPLERYLKPVKPANWSKIHVVIHQILLHLDCDGVDVFHLNDISNLIVNKALEKSLTPQELGYLWVLSQCFAAMRRNEV